MTINWSPMAAYLPQSFVRATVAPQKDACLDPNWGAKHYVTNTAACDLQQLFMSYMMAAYELHTAHRAPMI